MAKKSLGYVELEWQCPVCQTRNLGSERVCQGCGTPQPPDAKFTTPATATPSTEAEVIAKATAGPDVHCPYCDARNPADATVCKQCGGDLTEGTARSAGQVLGGVGDRSAEPITCPACGTENAAGARVCTNCGAPLEAAAPKHVRAEPAPTQTRGCVWIGAGVALVLLLALVVLFTGGGRRTEIAGSVIGSHWERRIQVLGLAPTTRAAWLDQIPADATVGLCTEDVREVVADPVPGAREVCGTPYAVDQGTGFAEVVQDCQYEILDQRCEYTVNEWRPVDQIVLQGTGPEAMWPELAGDGQQREGVREERYLCRFSAGDQVYAYQARSYDEYLLCEPGSSWSLVVGSSGRVLSATPVSR